MSADRTATAPVNPTRITSIDALRGLVMFTMIYVNDIAGAGKIVPDWMVHFSERHQGGSGMTFVDLVFPAFLFIVGMSIPFALGRRIGQGEPLWKTLLHIAGRTVSLLFIGILMVNESPDSGKMGWSAPLWVTWMYLSAILTFCSIAVAPESGKKLWRGVNLGLRVLGLASLIFLAFAFVGEDGHRIITLSPFSIHTEWYGILGIIAWSYLVGALVFLCFRGHSTALLATMVLLLCCYSADRKGFFGGFWVNRIVGIGGLAAHSAIVVAGLLQASVLTGTDSRTARERTRFTLWFIAGTAAGALLLNPLYGISKNSATTSWCLWSCAITAGLWLIFHWLCDIRSVVFLAKPLAAAGQNVFLAYLFSDLLPSALDLCGLGDWYGRLSQPSLTCAIARSAACAVIILAASVGLNRLGFRLKL